MGMRDYQWVEWNLFWFFFFEFPKSVIFFLTFFLWGNFSWKKFALLQIFKIHTYRNMRKQHSYCFAQLFIFCMNLPQVYSWNKITKHFIYTEKLFSPSVFEIVKNPRNVDLVCGSKVSNKVQKPSRKTVTSLAVVQELQKSIFIQTCVLKKCVASMKNFIEQYFFTFNITFHIFVLEQDVNYWVQIFVHTLVQLPRSQHN